ncbi:hypothetical protein DFH06DRAFT_1145322 [Mycena polygramma]|nr:hypothetical protein DFH06DRAFT_1145322 [Mycena polygramma]
MGGASIPNAPDVLVTPAPIIFNRNSRGADHRNVWVTETGTWRGNMSRMFAGYSDFKDVVGKQRDSDVVRVFCVDDIVLLTSDTFGRTVSKPFLVPSFLGYISASAEDSRPPRRARAERSSGEGEPSKMSGSGNPRPPASSSRAKLGRGRAVKNEWMYDVEDLNWA